MNPHAFTQPWIDAWRDELVASEEFRAAGARWQGAIAFVMTPEPELGMPDERCAWLDLRNGDCRAARSATPEDRATAPFVLRAPASTWERLLLGELEPIWALMGGKLQLDRGTITRLVPHARMARQLVRASRRANERFEPRVDDDLGEEG
ncbi:MAG: SCP2 sterol-binding domain-containing protein [Acidobacteriota bacterium]